MNKLPKEEDQTPKDDGPAVDSKAIPELNISKGKLKKNKKKKKQSNKSEDSVSSSSMSEVDSVPPLLIDEPAKEQFYDAHESYHGLPGDGRTNKWENFGRENQLLAPPVATPPAPAAPAIATTLLVAHSEHGQESKIQTAPPSAATRQGQSAGRAKKAPSTVSKPVTGPQ